MATTRLCVIPDCGKRRFGRGFCSKHYARVRKYGDPNGGNTGKGDLLRFVNEVALTTESDECIIWPYAQNGRGYGQIYVDGKNRSAHRYICQRTNGEPPTKIHEAAHSCGDGSCVNPRHLSWKTPVENAADKIIHGSHLRGQRSPHAKLTEEDVREIRNLNGVVSQREIAERYGVSGPAISHIISGERWGWLR